jgi:tetratricopeptide (TPR) repeat protein
MSQKTTLPNRAAAYLRGAGLALKAGQKDEAALFFLKGGEYETAALLFEQLGRFGEAAQAYEKAEQLDDAAAAWSRAGEHAKTAAIHEKQGRADEAAEAFAKAGEFSRAAECYAEAGRFVDAAKMASEANAEKAMIGYLQKVPADHADYREALVALARALIHRGWSALAVDTLESALGDASVNDSNLELWYALARAHDEQGELETASDILDRILALRFDYREADSWQKRLVQQIEQRGEPDASFDGERYVLGKLLGKGGMGAVYKARDCLLERDVAYKVLPESTANDRKALDQLLQEARSAAALNHPNIVTIHDVGVADGRAFISMELVDGNSYAAILRREMRLAISDVLHFLVSVCQGLDHAHRRGVIHRDIKPSNILLTSEDRVKIVDFGLARSVDAGGGRIGGTLKYIAPEQARGEATDARTDLYSLGATLYELLTGHAPFTSGNLVEHHLQSPVPPLGPERGDVPPALEALVLRCLEKEPSARFDSARAILAAVQSDDLVAE